MSAKNNDPAQNSQSATNEALADNADAFRGAADRNGTFEDLKNVGINVVPGVNILKAGIAGDTDKERNTTILKDNQIAEKATFLKDAKAAGMSDRDAANELKDIDKRTSVDAFDKQKLGQNQGGKYQKDYDRHVLDVFGDHKMQQVRADALTLYNTQRDDKQKLHNGNGLFKDKTTRSAADKTDHEVNQMLGLNNPEFDKLGSGNPNYNASVRSNRETQNQAGIGNIPTSSTPSSANQTPQVTENSPGNVQAKPKMNTASVSNTNTKTDFTLEQQLAQANQKNAILEQLLNGESQGVSATNTTNSQASGPSL